MPDTGKERISRRTFLRKTRDTAVDVAITGSLIGSGAAAGFVVNEMRHGEKKLTPLPANLEEERLQSAGIGDFHRFYALTRLMVSEFGGTIDYPNVRSIYEACARVGRAEADEKSPEVIRIRDDWGTDKDDLVEKAKKYVETIQIDTGPVISKEPIQENLSRFANVFPVHILASSPRITIDSAENRYFFDAAHNTMQIGYVINPSQDPFDLHNWFSEMNHALDFNWVKIKPHMDRASYARYLELYTESVSHIMRGFLSLDRAKARNVLRSSKIFSGIRDGYGGSDEQFNTKIGELENSFPEYSSQLTLEEKNLDALQRFGLLIHYIGNRFREVRTKQDLTQQDKDFTENLLARRLMSDAMTQVGHLLINRPSFFTNPTASIQRQDVDLDATIYAFNDNLVKIFSVVKNPTYDEVRRALGLRVYEITTEQQRYAETEASKVSRFLQDFGAKEIGEFEHKENDRKEQLYQLPQNPYAPERETLFVYLSNRDEELSDNSGFIISMPKDAFSPNRDDWKIDWGQDKDKRLQLSISVNNRQADIPIHTIGGVRTLGNFSIQKVDVIPNSSVVPLDSLARSAFVLKGDLGAKSVSKGLVRWKGEGGRVLLFPLPDDAESVNYFEELDLGHTKIFRQHGKTGVKMFTVTEGTPSIISPYPQLREGGKIEIDKSIISVDPQNIERVKAMLAKGNASVTTSPLYYVDAVPVISDVTGQQSIQFYFGGHNDYGIIDKVKITIDGYKVTK